MVLKTSCAGWDIINLSLRSGIVTSVRKSAWITPIFKSGDIKKPENYMPISILPIFSKILERAIYTQLSSYLERNNLLNSRQFKYRSNRSTKLALTLLCNNIRTIIDKGEMVGAVFIDLNKAFDTVGHGHLLNKLHVYGIGGVEHEWMKTYLFIVNNSYSWKDIILNKSTIVVRCATGFHSGTTIIRTVF